MRNYDNSNVAFTHACTRAFIKISLLLFMVYNSAFVNIVLAGEGGNPCLSCFEMLRVSLHSDCKRAITVEMLVPPAALALTNPADYDIKLSVGNGLNLSDDTLRQQHVGKTVMATVRYLGDVCADRSPCMTMIEVIGNDQAGLEDLGSISVYCTDPFLDLDPSSTEYPRKPGLMTSCGSILSGPYYGGDWVMVHDCEVGVQDTFKTIFRQWWALNKMGERILTIDTIYVFRLPPLSATNFYCSDKDSLYCDDTEVQVGPYILVSQLNSDDCDTIFLLDNYQNAISPSEICGISVHLDTLPFANSGCKKLTKYTITAHQYCYGQEQTTCLLPDASPVQIVGGAGEPIIAECSFWLSELDTLPPSLSCDLTAYTFLDSINGKPAALVSAGANCYAQMVLPPVLAEDVCNNVALVKAIIDTVGVAHYEFDEARNVWLNLEPVPLPTRVEPYEIIIKAFDDCYNLSMDTCYIKVKDQSGPTPATHDTVRIDLSTKLDYVSALQFDNESDDNCGISLILARRVDWVSHWPLFCDTVQFATFETSELDTIWMRMLEEDFMKSEYEAYYAQQIENYEMLYPDCGSLIQEGWRYDLAREATMGCLGKYTQGVFDSLYQDIFAVPDMETVRSIGGGWAEEIPVSCQDVCGHVDVEVLVMDYWCNWSLGSSVLSVEDKETDLLQDLSESLDISCKVFYGDSAYALSGEAELQSLATVVERAADGDPEAIELVNEILGTYVGVWVKDGEILDENHDPVATQLEFQDSMCQCSLKAEDVRYYDLDTEMIVEEIDSMFDTCYFDTRSVLIDQGLFAINCAENVHVTQSISFAPDECGIGTIEREFRIWKNCHDEDADTIKAIQSVNIVRHCEVSKYHFDLPKDSIVITCGPGYDSPDAPDGSAHPNQTGWPVYLLNDCEEPAVAYRDDILSVHRDKSCYLIVRNWYFADSCQIDGITDWWTDPTHVVDSHQQYISLLDTTMPVCQIEVLDEVDDTVSIGDCSNSVFIDLIVADECRVMNFSYTIDSLEVNAGIRGWTPVVSNGPLNTSPVLSFRDTLRIEKMNFTAPDQEYRVTLTVRDECGHESTCIDSFVVECTVSRLAQGMAEAFEIDGVEQNSKGLTVEPDPSGIWYSWSPNNVQKGSFELLQNRPNPFSDHTIIGFTMPVGGEARLRIYDVQGRTLKIIKGHYMSGYHELEVMHSDLKATGVLYYQLDTKDFSRTRRMIITP